MITQDESTELGRILVEMRALDPDDLERAMGEHHKTGDSLGAVLQKMNLVSEENFLRALARQLGLRFQRLTDLEVDAAVLARVPARLATHYKIMPLQLTGDTLEVALHDPQDIHVLDDLRLNLRLEIEPVVATHKDIHDTIKKYYGIGADTLQEMVEDQEQTVAIDATPQVADIEDMAEDASVIRFMNQIVMEAIGDRATDIHIEPMEDDLRIRYRVDGVLYESPVPPAIKRFQSAIISRVKIMADMDIAERRLPLDGKIKIKRGAEEFDMRVSTVPTPYGESVAIRILTRDKDFINLERLGYNPEQLSLFRGMITRPHGIVLVTGPTGSGKSTTLYAALTEINTPEVKIITTEDPIEYRMGGVTQIQVSPHIGLTFSRCLRAILRQDPDVLLVGEIRDTETAEISIQMALTGHLVFSTLHTNDACGAVTRLLDMHVEPFLVSSSLEGLIAQRLIRVLCPNCKQPLDAASDLLARVNVTRDAVGSYQIFKPMGCEACRYRGYTGRTAITEMVQVNENFRRMIVERSTADVLRHRAVQDGMKSMRHDGWNKIKAGMTSIEEVLSATMEEGSV